MSLFGGLERGFSHHKQDDEDEGSPSRGGANDSTLGQLLITYRLADESENRKISGSPPGAPPPEPFPPIRNAAYKISRQLERQKGRKWHQVNVGTLTVTVFLHNGGTPLCVELLVTSGRKMRPRSS